MCDATDLDPRRLDQTGDIHGGRFTLDIRIGCDNQLLDIAALQTRDQRLQVDISRTDALHRRNNPMQDVVKPMVFADAFHRHHVAWAFNHANGVGFA